MDIRSFNKNRLSERRGLGLLTLNRTTKENNELASSSAAVSADNSLQRTRSWSTVAAFDAVTDPRFHLQETDGNPSIRIRTKDSLKKSTSVPLSFHSSSKRDMENEDTEQQQLKIVENNFHSSVRQQDGVAREEVELVDDDGGIGGGEVEVATVQELRRDVPADSSTSPSSNFRASLPGFSPRWPHTYHHGAFSSIFSFDSLQPAGSPSTTSFSFSSSSSSSSSTASSSSSPYQFRRILSHNSLSSRAAASYRLPTLAEKPTGNVSSVQLARHRLSQTPQHHQCALLIGVDSTLSLDLLTLSTIQSEEPLQLQQQQSIECDQCYLVPSTGLPRAWQKVSPVLTQFGEKLPLPPKLLATETSDLSLSLCCSSVATSIVNQHSASAVVFPISDPCGASLTHQQPIEDPHLLPPPPPPSPAIPHAVNISLGASKQERGGGGEVVVPRTCPRPRDHQWLQSQYLENPGTRSVPDKNRPAFCACANLYFPAPPFSSPQHDEPAEHSSTTVSIDDASIQTVSDCDLLRRNCRIKSESVKKTKAKSSDVVSAATVATAATAATTTVGASVSDVGDENSSETAHQQLVGKTLRPSGLDFASSLCYFDAATPSADPFVSSDSQELSSSSSSNRESGSSGVLLVHEGDGRPSQLESDVVSSCRCCHRHQSRPKLGEQIDTASAVAAVALIAVPAAAVPIVDVDMDRHSSPPAPPLSPSPPSPSPIRVAAAVAPASLRGVPAALRCKSIDACLLPADQHQTCPSCISQPQSQRSSLSSSVSAATAVTAFGTGNSTATVTAAAAATRAPPLSTRPSSYHEVVGSKMLNVNCATTLCSAVTHDAAAVTPTSTASSNSTSPSVDDASGAHHPNWSWANAVAVKTTHPIGTLIGRMCNSPSSASSCDTTTTTTSGANRPPLPPTVVGGSQTPIKDLSPCRDENSSNKNESSLSSSFLGFRRAFSADRPVPANYRHLSSLISGDDTSNSKTATSENSASSGSSSSNSSSGISTSAASNAGRTPKARSTGPTKVDRLRQLTQRLRPSSSSSSSSSSLPPSGVLPASPLPSPLPPPPNRLANCLVSVDSSSSSLPPSGQFSRDPNRFQQTNQLPPLPTAPPRPPRGRCERKKSARAKKDSATSTSDLVAPPSETSPPSTPQPSGGDGTELPTTSTESSSVTAKNGDNIRKKIATEMTRRSLFLPPPPQSPPPSTTMATTNEDSSSSAPAVSGPNDTHRGASFSSSSCNTTSGGEGLFFNHTSKTDVMRKMESDSGSANRSITASSSVSGGEDLFDDVHVAKLNPRILVGTYQQRTIPFRSASFSQIDVGADGTYNRRPRTAITLRPVTYSIGRDSPTNSMHLQSMSGNTGEVNANSNSLPRRPKIDDGDQSQSQTQPHTSSRPLLLQLAEDVQETTSLPPVSRPSSSSQPRCWVEPPGDLCSRSTATKDESEPIITAEECCSSPPSPSVSCSIGVDDQGQVPITATSCVQSVVDIVGAFVAEKEEIEHSMIQMNEQIVEEEKCRKESAATNIKSGPVSFTAEIRLSPGPGSAESLEADVVQERNAAATAQIDSTSEDVVTLPVPSVKPLPVLDLLELNNHLLRLKAATRDSGHAVLDHLADLEVASQFLDEKLTAATPSVDSSQEPGVDAGGHLCINRPPPVDQVKSERRPSWLNEILRLANGERESNSSLSDEGCVADSAELRYTPPPHHSTQEKNGSAIVAQKRLQSHGIECDEAIFPPLPSSISGLDCVTRMATSGILSQSSGELMTTTTAEETQNKTMLHGNVSDMLATTPLEQLERKSSSKRRRRSSSLAISNNGNSNSTYHSDSSVCSTSVRNKSNTTITFPAQSFAVNVTDKSGDDRLSVPQENEDGDDDDDDDNLTKELSALRRPVLTSQLSTGSQVDSQLATDESVSSDMFVDAFESIGIDEAENETTKALPAQLRADSAAVSMLSAAIQQIATDSCVAQSNRVPTAKVSFSLGGDGPPVRIPALAAMTRDSQRSSADSNDLDDDDDDDDEDEEDTNALEDESKVLPLSSTNRVIVPIHIFDETVLASSEDDGANVSSKLKKSDAEDELDDDDDEDDDEEALDSNKKLQNECVLTSPRSTLTPEQPRPLSSLGTQSPPPPPLLSCSPTPQQLRTASPSPLNPDLESNSLLSTPSTKQQLQQKSPLVSRRYGLKRRPLRGPYGEMLEAEMNKSEFGKMYTKRTEDLNFLLARELIGPLSNRLNRDVKSTSPRPLSPASPTCSSPIGISSATNGSDASSTLFAPTACSASSSSSATVRQNSLPLPTSHSLDDSQLKVGYNTTGSSSTLPAGLPASVALTGSAGSVLVPPKRKISANFPYVLSDGDLELSATSGVGKANRGMVHHPSPLSRPTNVPPSLGSGGTSAGAISHLLNSTATAVSAPIANHQRTSSSPCQLIFTEAGFTSEDEPELLELTSLSSTLSRSTQQLLQPDAANSSNSTSSMADRHTLPLTRVGSAKRSRDTRTHAIGELYDTERSYVESLQILVTKYFQPLKSPENSGLIEGALVDEIFYQVPAILVHHEVFLEELRKRLESWDSKQCVGGVFLETLTKPSVIETYTAYINHWKHAKEAVKLACLAKSAFSKFLETMAREHKGKLALDSLLIMPVQRIPRYELLIKMLLKHTPRDHPDHSLLLEAQKEVHELAVKINCVEREAYGAEQQQATLRELESLVEGLGPGNLATPERIFIRHDCVTIPSALGTRKERGLFLFSDLLVITSVKRRGAAMRKSSSYSTSGIASTLEANKFKLLMRVPLDDLEISSKGKDEGSRRSTRDLEHLEEDLATLNQVTELVSSLHIGHLSLDEAIKEVHHGIQRQLNEKQSTSEPQLATIELSISTQDGTETLSVAFMSSEKRASWEDSFIETKLKLRAMSPDRRPPPEFLSPLPIRKTRAGLQFTCAAPTVSWNSQHLRDVWVCNSDGYVGQVCILSLHPEPNVASCNGVCNARITCIAAVPASTAMLSDESVTSFIASLSKNEPKLDGSPEGIISSNDIKSSNFELESESSSDSSEGEESADEDSSCPPGVNFSHIRADSVPVEVNVSSDDPEVSIQATMWLGTEDGCIHIYHCGENIRLKKNRIRIQQGAAVLCIVYMENRVFASLANGDVVVYFREANGVWNINEPQCISVGSLIAPVTRMLAVNNGLWCAAQNTIKILDTSLLSIEEQFPVSSDSQRSVLSMSSNGFGVWVAMQGSAVVRLFHALSHECICDVNLAPAVNKMLAGCDDIIRQHKAACLRVTSMLVCRDLLWVGTSAGVILTIPTPHLTVASSRLSSTPIVTGIPHGHTGHVRFLTCVEATPDAHCPRSSRLNHTAHHRFSLKGKDTLVGVISSTTNVSTHGTRLLVISGGDGYEDFRQSSFPDSVGREDSTNHLLLWQV